jgi:hypothetical protein
MNTQNSNSLSSNRTKRGPKSVMPVKPASRRDGATRHWIPAGVYPERGRRTGMTRETPSSWRIMRFCISIEESLTQ